MQQYRIFDAMLGLSEFTVAELAHASGANARTVRTTLRRHEHLVEPVSRESRGGPGGAWIRYRLKEGATDWIGTRLGALESRVSPPLDLLVAEELLLDRIPDERDEHARARMRSRVRRLLSAAAATQLRGSAARLAARHTAIVELLLELSEAHEEPATSGHGRRTPIAVSRELRGHLEELGDGALDAKVRALLARAPWAPADPREGQVESGLEAELERFGSTDGDIALILRELAMAHRHDEDVEVVVGISCGPAGVELFDRLPAHLRPTHVTSDGSVHVQLLVAPRGSVRAEVSQPLTEHLREIASDNQYPTHLVGQSTFPPMFFRVGVNNATDVAQTTELWYSKLTAEKLTKSRRPALYPAKLQDAATWFFRDDDDVPVWDER